MQGCPTEDGGTPSAAGHTGRARRGSSRRRHAACLRLQDRPGLAGIQKTLEVPFSLEMVINFWG